VEVAVADLVAGGSFALAAAAPDAPTSSVGDPCQLRDLDVGEFSGPVALVAAGLLRGCLVALVEPAQANPAGTTSPLVTAGRR
jgi:hypothetical protein